LFLDNGGSSDGVPSLLKDSEATITFAPRLDNHPSVVYDNAFDNLIMLG
jgi:hypothetical protein